MLTAASTAVCAWNSAGKLILNKTFSMTYEPKLCGILKDSPLKRTSSNPHVFAVKTLGYPISPDKVIIASLTARLVASPAAQLFRDPAFGACLYVLKLCPSNQA